MTGDPTFFRQTSSATGATGGQAMAPSTRLVKCVLGRFEVTVILSGSNEFLGIKEIAVQKDFRSHEQRLAGSRVHEVDEYYKE